MGEALGEGGDTTAVLHGAGHVLSGGAGKVGTEAEPGFKAGPERRFLIPPDSQSVTHPKTGTWNAFGPQLSEQPCHEGDSIGIIVFKNHFGRFMFYWTFLQGGEANKILKQQSWFSSVN